MNTEFVRRFSFCCMKSQVKDNGYIKMVETVKKFPNLKDLHIAGGQTAITEAVFDSLEQLIERDFASDIERPAPAPDAAADTAPRTDEPAAPTEPRRDD